LTRAIRPSRSVSEPAWDCRYRATSSKAATAEPSRSRARRGRGRRSTSESPSKEHYVDRILLVDDEEMVITSIRAFLQLETDYEIHGFTDPIEAAAFMEANEVAVAVSDYLMPHINGIQFLGRVKERQPEASRVLLTGHADKQSAIQAINQVSLFQYLEKPWDN